MILGAKREPLIIPSRALKDGMTKEDLKLMRELGLFPEIAGGDEGYNQVGDIVTQTADGRDLNEIWAEYRRVLAAYNAERDPLFASLTFEVTRTVEDVFQAGNTIDFEEASEFGVPRGVRAAPPTYYSLGYTFKWYDVGARFTWMFLAENPSDQVDALNNMIIEADNRLLFTQAMKQIFNNVTRTATINENAYNVYPIYNGDATVPPRWKQTIHTANHQHFLASGAATVVSADLDDMEAHLKHHGYGWQEGTALILLVNSQEMATIRTFRVDAGDSYDFIQSQGIPGWALTTVDVDQFLNQTQAAPSATFNGLTVQGRYGPWLVVEEDLITAGYMLGFASGGTQDARNLVGIRQHENASLRGLRLVKGREPDYPLIDSYYQRGFGTGIRQRGAAVVMQITAGAYTIPTGYEW